MKITPEMVREAEAHFPFALAEGPTKGPRWQWFADFYNHALENPGAPCPCCNVTPDGDIMDHLPEPPEPGASTEPWPRFILDEALVVLRNVDTQFRATGQPSARVERLINLLAGMVGRTAPQPPSAPVGVEDLAASLRESRERMIAALTPKFGDAFDGDFDVMRDAADALAQQPAAAGEEIMVNAAHDVYTLPLQPSGLSSGPRFVVHVPAPEQQPAAVDEMAGLLEQIRDLLASLPVDCLGSGTDASGQAYPIRDEVIHGITKALAQQPASEVYVDFPQVGTAGPLAVVDGKVTLPDATMNDLIRHARTGYVEQPAAVDEAMVERVTDAVVAWGSLPGDPPAEPEQVAELRGVIAAAFAAHALAAQQGGGTDE